MKNVSLARVTGMELRWVREQAGWSRTRMSAMLKRSGSDAEISILVKSLERYERLPIVPVLFVQHYRKVMNPDIFDELLQLARETSAAGQLEGMIKWGRVQGGRRSATDPPSDR